MKFHWLALSLLLTSPALAMNMDMGEMPHAMGPEDCGHMEVWDYATAMCLPLPMAGMPMKMLMLHGNAFLNQGFAEKPRGRNAFSVPNMVMLDVGTSVGENHYLNLDFMGTAEKWTFPKSGYPELLQIGEENEDHVPFRDAQHPHSSPVMGLTLSDTISLQNEKDHIKVWFAPRGQSTDGPVAFMHRPTGMQNPDAPLGHHIGQDVGHITSTVIGAQLRLSQSNLEISSFHGEEPEPTEVDLPIGSPNSFAARFTQQLNPHFYAMASAAYVKHPETHATGPDHIWRYSASAYNDFSFENGWMLHNTLIWGMVKNYDEASTLHSFGEEFWFHKGPANIWSRLELLQRTPAELAISGYGDENKGRWVTAATLGYTHTLASWEGLNLGLGGSVTKDFLPEGFRAAYGGNPWSGRVFLRLNGMKMWEL